MFIKLPLVKKTISLYEKSLTSLKTKLLHLNLQNISTRIHVVFILLYKVEKSVTVSMGSQVWQLKTALILPFFVRLE